MHKLLLLFRLLPRVVTAVAGGVNAVGLYSVVDGRWWTKLLHVGAGMGDRRIVDEGCRRIV